jgi:hypothetical protein
MLQSAQLRVGKFICISARATYRGIVASGLSSILIQSKPFVFPWEIDYDAVSFWLF